MNHRVIEHPPLEPGVRIGIVASRFNREVVEGLLRGALEELAEQGITGDALTVVWVPGALELAPVARRLVDQREVEGIIALGCVVRGETAHFELVSRESMAALCRLCFEHRVPVGVGVLTVESLAQARVRAGLEADAPSEKEHDRHRGREAARACLETLAVLQALSQNKV